MEPTNARRAKMLQDSRLARLIIENAVEYAIFTLDMDGVITTWSPGAEAVLGYTAEEAVGMSASVLFTASDQSAGVDRIEMERTRTLGRAEDSRWHVRKNGERFWANGVTILLDDPELSGLLKVMRDETPQKLAEDQRVLLLNELNHRIKNTLATVQSIADQTLRAGNVPAATRENLTSRLIALSEAHNVLVAENWAGADLHAIVERALAPHRHGETPRFKVDGPTVRLSPQRAVALSLVLHELTTNALKYGALSNGTGAIEVTWNLSHDRLGGRHMTLLWREQGGPYVETPTHRGFGSRLIERTVTQENGGRAQIEYQPEGLCCSIELPLSSAEEIPMLDLNSHS